MHKNQQILWCCGALAMLGTAPAWGQPNKPAQAPPQTQARLASSRANVDECLAQVRTYHLGAGPWAVLGFRVGEQMLDALKLPRGSMDLVVEHQSPAKVQYTCICDGLQAATGASLGRMNLRWREAPAPEPLRTRVTQRSTGRSYVVQYRPEFLAGIQDLPYDRLEAEGRRVAALEPNAMFVLKPEPTQTPSSP